MTAPSASDGGDPPPAIRVEGLAKTFGTDEAAVTAVDGVSLTVERGSVVGLLGPNGAGKTTTVKAMLGLVVPDAGTVEVCGVDAAVHPRRAHDHVGVVLEGARNVYWRLTVRENLRFFAGLGGDPPAAVRERHDRLLSLLGLADRADTPVNELSRGMKGKVALASTLARDVDVVFLDEPTLGLDVEASLDLRAELRRLADREDVTVVLTSHDMDVVEAVCDRVVVLDDGRVVVDDAVDALLSAFDATRYRVTVDARPSADCRRVLAERFDATVARTDDAYRVTVTASDAEALYSLLKTLKADGANLHAVHSDDPDMETVFRRAVADDRDGSRPGDHAGDDGASRETGGAEA